MHYFEIQNSIWNGKPLPFGACCTSINSHSSYLFSPAIGKGSMYMRLLLTLNRTRSSVVAETARRFVALNILLSHPRSLKVIRNNTVSRACVSLYYSISLKLCLYLVPFLRYSASKNGVTLKLGVGVVQGHRKWRRSIDHIRLFIGPPLYIARSGIVFLSYLKLNDYRNLEI